MLSSSISVPPARQWESIHRRKTDPATETTYNRLDGGSFNYIRNTVKALFRKGNPKGMGVPSPTASVRRAGGWFGGAGQAPDALFHAWAVSPDRWWRRAALVSTVAWNVRSLGGRGDAPRTLAVCRLLAADPDDMVVKALSWALRMLATFDPAAVGAFLAEYDLVLAGRVKREVRHKLATGLKNPRYVKRKP